MMNPASRITAMLKLRMTRAGTFWLSGLISVLQLSGLIITVDLSKLTFFHSLKMGYTFLVAALMIGMLGGASAEVQMTEGNVAAAAAGIKAGQYVQLRLFTCAK